MKRSMLLFCCVVLLSCNGGQGNGDAPRPGDLFGPGESIPNQDLPPRLPDGPLADVPGDRGGPLDLSRVEQGSADAQPVDLARDTRPPDTRPPDTKPPPPPPNPCRTSWSLWSCLNIPNGCSATCSTYQMTCMQVSLNTSCTCKQGTVEKSCKTSGTGCLMCSTAIAQGCCDF